MIWRLRIARALPIVLSLVAAALYLRASAGGQAGALAWIVILTALPLGALVAALLALGLGRRRGIAPALLCVVFLAPAGWSQGLFPVAYPGTPNAPPTLVRLPVDGPIMVLQGGARATRNHHAMFPNQRWAYDLVVPPVRTDGGQNADHGCWDVPVLAPAAGRVVATIDQWHDQAPGTAGPEGAPPGGNQVVLRLDDGTFLFIAHLRFGSIAVLLGASVLPGQMLGRCGNSGASDVPHIHLHRQAEPPGSAVPELDTGLPLGFCGHGGPSHPEGLPNGLLRSPDPRQAPIFTHSTSIC